MSDSVIQGSFPGGIASLHAALQRQRPCGPAQTGAVQPHAAQMAPHVAAQVAQLHAAPHRPPMPHQTSLAIQTRQTASGMAVLLPSPPRITLAGQALPNDVRQLMESVFRTAFHDVRVHVGPHVQTLGATAYTQGSHIHFAPGQYDPRSPRGRQLLAHELAHVVQQRAGRARNPFGSGVAIVHDAMLEAEAERHAAVALRATERRVAVQLLKSHAMAYIRTHALGIGSTGADIRAYIANTANPEQRRRELLRAWNRRGKARQPDRIAMPADLLPDQVVTISPQFDFSGYDSDDDRKMDVAATLGRITERVTLRRGGGATVSNVPVVDRVEVIRIGRQIARSGIRDARRLGHLPLVANYNGHRIEFDSPGTEDVYAFPLRSTGPGTYERAGSTSSFNWKNLADQLDAAAPTPEDRAAKRARIFNEFRGERATLTPDEAEAVAAMACDFIKGSGNSEYIRSALAALTNDRTFREVFSTDAPVYAPAARGGRALVTAETARRRAAAPTAAAVATAPAAAAAVAAPATSVPTPTPTPPAAVVVSAAAAAAAAAATVAATATVGAATAGPGAPPSRRGVKRRRG
ncbi:MAG: DUF4157 domain-containing protein [Acidobacteria bacterium]|nr:DUF4157 domain-containing protein [Acidobacteriota bacterium]MBV9477122.1 DUF4157 domain-containing protein [Acidobacteriota bacterium]